MIALNATIDIDTDINREGGGVTAVRILIFISQGGVLNARQAEQKIILLIV